MMLKVQKIIYEYINSIQFFKENKIRLYISIPKKIIPPYLKIDSIICSSEQDLNKTISIFEFSISGIETEKNNQNIIKIFSNLSNELCIKSKEIHFDILSIFDINYKIFEDVEIEGWIGKINFKVIVKNSQLTL